MCETVITKTENADVILRAALDVGEHILRSGGEVQRVEDTISRICKAFGAEHVEVFAISSVIIGSIRMPDGEYCQQMRRIYKSANNMYFLEEMNRISRALCTKELKIEDLTAEINRARKKKPYSPWLMILCGAFAAAGFTLFFGGTWRDAICAGIVAIPIVLLTLYVPRFASPLFMTLINSVVAGIVSILLWRCGLGQNVDKIMIGDIMLLIPGLAFTNSIRDLMTSNTLSGITGLLQSILQAVIIAFGFVLPAFFLGESRTPLADLSNGNLVIIVSAVVGVLGFCVLFGVRKELLIWSGLGGLVATAVYLLCLPLGDFTSNAIAAFCLMLFCEIIARCKKAPVVCFLVTGVLVLVPGRALYYTFSFMMAKNMQMVTDYGLKTVVIALGIIAGILIAELCFNIVFDIIHRYKEKQK